MNGHAIKEAARAIAMVVHDGQSRKGAGEPYFNHCERVADAVWGWRAKTLAYLHDTVEDAADTEAMAAALRQIFPADIVDGVLLLSRLHDSSLGRKPTYEDFISTIIAGGDPDVIAVKLADVDDNLRDIADIPNAQTLMTRYLRAKAALAETDIGKKANKPAP